VNSKRVRSVPAGKCRSSRPARSFCPVDAKTSAKLSTAESHVYVSSALAGRLETPLLSPGLEEGLIHFIYGRQLGSDEREHAPTSHQALRATEYLDPLAEGLPNIKEVYAELCQMTHRASDSLFCFAARHDRLVVRYTPGRQRDQGPAARSIVGSFCVWVAD
jgi:hypothetical protein